MIKKDWIIHLVMNGAECGECEKKENGFLRYTCDSHTHGMEKYNHPNFQIVVDFEPDYIMGILNILCFMVQSGRKFHNGEFVEGIIDERKLRLDKHIENGFEIFRVVFPDDNNLFPEDANCKYPYSVQNFKVKDLYIENYIGGCKHE